MKPPRLINVPCVWCGFLEQEHVHEVHCLFGNTLYRPYHWPTIYACLNTVWAHMASIEFVEHYFVPTEEYLLAGNAQEYFDRSLAAKIPRKAFQDASRDA